MSEKKGGSMAAITDKAQETRQLDTYYQWQADEGIPIITGLGIEDLRTVELGLWERMGGRGAFVNLGRKPSPVTSSYLVEVPAGGSLNAQTHMCEQVLYVVSGRGATTVWLE